MSELIEKLKSIQKYDIYATIQYGDSHLEVEPRDYGDYIKYDDVEELINQIETT